LTPSTIRRQRLSNRQLAASRFDTPAELVRWMGAVQAQDYLGGLWGVGLRVADATEADVEAAVAAAACRAWARCTRNAPRRATPWPSAETRPGSSAHRWS
jgi:hypothetical protein